MENISICIARRSLQKRCHAATPVEVTACARGCKSAPLRTRHYRCGTSRQPFSKRWRRQALDHLIRGIRRNPRRDSDVLARAAAGRRRERFRLVGALDGAALGPFSYPLACVGNNSCRGAAAGENASDAVTFTVFRGFAALMPRVRIDASVHRRLRGRKSESRSQN